MTFCQHYECDLCDVTGEATSMMGHLQGRDHRAKYLGEHYGRPSAFASMNTVALEKEANEIAENKMKMLNRIRTFKVNNSGSSVYNRL